MMLSSILLIFVIIALFFFGWKSTITFRLFNKRLQSELTILKQDNAKTTKDLHDLSVDVNAVQTLMQSAVINNINSSIEMYNIIEDIWLGVDLNKPFGKFIVNYLKKKQKDVLEALKMAKHDLSLIYKDSFKQILMDRNELKVDFLPEGVDFTPLIDEIDRINTVYYNKLRNDMAVFAKKYPENQTILYELLKKKTLKYFALDCRKCFDTFDKFFNENMQKKGEIFFEQTEQILKPTKQKRADVIFFLRNNYIYEAIRAFNLLISKENESPEINKIKDNLIVISANFSQLEDDKNTSDNLEYQKNFKQIIKNILLIYNEFIRYKKQTNGKI